MAAPHHPDLDAAFIDEALREFVAVYRYFIGPAGLPILGRSACYRLAAPVPLVFAQAAAPPLVSAGEARRTLDVVWQRFITHGAVIRGNVTQGYYDEDPRLLEDYSGPASCLWSLRALVAAFALPDDGAFWEATPAPLPIERNDYRIAIAPPGWTLVGERTSGRICIETGRTESRNSKRIPFSRESSVHSPGCHIAQKMSRQNIIELVTTRVHPTALHDATR